MAQREAEKDVPREIQPVMCGLLGSLSVFDAKSSDFTVFKERLNQFFIANGITEEVRKKAILLNTLSEECYVLVRSLCVPDLPESKTFKDLIKILKEHFTPVKSYFAERLKFYSAKRNEKESVSEWAARIKNLASTCQFGNELNTVMRDIFVIGINNSAIMDRLLEEDASSNTVTLSKMIKIAQGKESALLEHKMREGSSGNSPTEAVYYGKQKQPWKSRSAPEKRLQQGIQESQHFSSASRCVVCGRKNHTSKECRFRNSKCHKCGIKGHLAPVCTKRTKHANSNQHFLLSNNPEQQECQECIFSLSDIDNNGNVKPTYVKLLVENINLNFQADSGFAHAAISEKLYLKYFQNKTLYSNDLALKDYIGISVKPMGYVTLNIKYDNIPYQLKTYVIKNGGPPLIGRNGLHMLKLGISKIQFIDEKESNSNICNVKDLLDNFNDVFEKKVRNFQ